MAERPELQQIGEELINKGWDYFCTKFLNFTNWKAGESIIIDGIRHPGFFQEIKNKVKPQACYFVYLTINDSVRLERMDKREKDKSAVLNESHSTEQYHEELVKIADIILDTSNRTPNELSEEVLKLIYN